MDQVVDASAELINRFDLGEFGYQFLATAVLAVVLWSMQRIYKFGIFFFFKNIPDIKRFYRRRRAIIIVKSLKDKSVRQNYQYIESYYFRKMVFYFSVYFLVLFPFLRLDTEWWLRLLLFLVQANLMKEASDGMVEYLGRSAANLETSNRILRDYQKPWMGLAASKSGSSVAPL